MKYQECFPPSRALCMAEESCMELKKIMFLISIHGSMMILHNLLLTKSHFEHITFMGNITYSFFFKVHFWIKHFNFKCTFFQPVSCCAA